MAQEDKDLLLKDLCARLPYHPIVYVDENLPRLKLGVATRVWEYIAVDKPCKPYLRPMSSMTEEEQKEFAKFHCVNICPIVITENLTISNEAKMFDWLNKKMFDYRGLIEKGLAIEVTDNNNPYKD